MKEVVIVDAIRTPMGSYGRSLRSIPAVELGTIVVKEILKRNNLDPVKVDEMIFGCVLQAGQGQNVARQVLINSDIPIEVPAVTINMVCASGLRAVSFAAQMIKAGDVEVVIAGGTENMSATPYALGTAGWGADTSESPTVNLMIHDGLWEIFNNYHMGITAENIADKYGLSRIQQDEFALRSQKLAEKAINEGRFKDEIVPVLIPQEQGDPKVFDTDEQPRLGTTMEGLGKLKPAFKKDGTVTAGNASGINDGAAAILVMSRDRADKEGYKPIAKIVSYASAGVDPKIMGTGPIPSTRKALEKAGLKIEDIDLIELNEAFASQSLAVIRDLNLDMNKVNLNGGAIALGHPIGASGARILTTLLYELKRRPDAKLGLATICVGGGMGHAIIVEKM